MDLVESYRQELTFARTPVARTLLALLALALAVWPWVAPEHLVFLTTLVALYAIGVMGQNLLIGYTGQVSFGQAGFLAIGAFAFGHLRGWGAPFLLALAGAGSSRRPPASSSASRRSGSRDRTWPSRRWGSGSPCTRCS